jgi:sulfur relay protein TusB/DsrH
LNSNQKLIYLFGFSSSQTTQLNLLLPILKDQIDNGLNITVVLLHDGVIGISNHGLRPDTMNELLALKLKVCALIPDIEARGMNSAEIDNRIQTIDYDELVDYLAQIPRIISWL